LVVAGKVLVDANHFKTVIEDLKGEKGVFRIHVSLIVNELTLTDQACKETFFIDLIPEAGMKGALQGYAEDHKDDENDGKRKTCSFPR
jgi:hypothetical protein